MRVKLRSLLGSVAVALAALVAATPGQSDLIVVELIRNGDFEAGLADWNVHSRNADTSYDDSATPPDGSFFPQNDSGITPFSGLETIGPHTGSFYALADSTAPGVRVLIQRFTTPGVLLEATLHFAMFTYDWSGFGPEGSDFDFETAPNQHVQIDVLTGDADPFATDPASVVASLYNDLPPNPPGFDPPEWQQFVFDLTPFLAPGQSYQLRFAEVSNLFVLNLGIDDVSVLAVIPEPSALGLMGSGLIVVLAAARRRAGRHRAG